MNRAPEEQDSHCGSWYVAEKKWQAWAQEEQGWATRTIWWLLYHQALGTRPISHTGVERHAGNLTRDESLQQLNITALPLIDLMSHCFNLNNCSRASGARADTDICNSVRKSAHHHIEEKWITRGCVSVGISPRQWNVIQKVLKSEAAVYNTIRFYNSRKLSWYNGVRVLRWHPWMYKDNRIQHWRWKKQKWPDVPHHWADRASTLETSANLNWDQMI